MIKVSGIGSIILGLFVIVLCIAYILAAGPVVKWATGLPIIGDWILDVMQQIIYFPNAQYIFPLMGIFAVYWGISILQKQNWARIVGAILHGAAACYLFSFVLVIVVLEEVSKVRWYLLLFGLVVTVYLVYVAYRLLQKDVQWNFANKYHDPDDVDMPKRARKPEREPELRPEPIVGPPPKKPATELARLIPAAGGQDPYIITEQMIDIGREDSPLSLDSRDTSISRQHAKIYFENERPILEDISRNGTTVNGKRIKKDKIPLPDGAEILFGRRAKFTFRYGPGLKDATEPEPAVVHPERPEKKESIDLSKPKGTDPLALARLEPLWPEGKTYDMTKDQVIMGRDPKSCDFVLHATTDVTVSSRHAELSKVGEKFILRDLNSTNGTFVNNNKITEIELADGAEIHLGVEKTQFIFRNLSAPPEATDVPESEDLAGSVDLPGAKGKPAEPDLSNPPQTQ